MANSKTEIANLALGFVGYGSEIEDLDTDVSDEALACRRFYDVARDMLFSMHPWSFLAKFAEPTLIEEDPTTEWEYSYQLPNDFISMRRLVDDRNLPRDSQQPYRIVTNTLYCDIEDVVIEYNHLNETVTQYSPAFKIALARLIASMIAPRLVSGEQGTAMAARLEGQFYRDLSVASAQAGNNELVDIPPESEFIRTRE